MQFWSLRGICSYDNVRDLQLALVELRSKGLIEDTFLFLEHSPTITRGRGLQFTGLARPKQIPLAQPLPDLIQFFESERGGDLTYHGPGQLVIYPICKLDGTEFGPKYDIGAFLRKLETLLIDELKSFGLQGRSQSGATGVWIGEKKIASIGIAVRKWVTFHGIALNCVNDLSPFFLISPCGFNPDVMTRLADAVPLNSFDSIDWRDRIENSIAARIQNQDGKPAEIRKMDLHEAQALINGVGYFPGHSEDAIAPAES